MCSRHACLECLNAPSGLCELESQPEDRVGWRDGLECASCALPRPEKKEW